MPIFKKEPQNENTRRADQPIVFGAASKSTKTLQLVDLAVALAKPDQPNVERKWLGHFNVPNRKRVLFITAKSNERAIARTFDKALEAHGTSLDDLKGWVRINALSVPRLARWEDLEALAADVAENGFDVVILDPLYPSLAGLESKMMEDRGAAIRDLFQAVQPAALIYSHHFTKSASRNHGEPPQLEDLTGSGLAESAGNWWLMRRNKAYEGSKKHDLVVLYGGRDGQAGRQRIVFDEDQWKFTVENFDEYRDSEWERKQNERFTKNRADEKQRTHDLLEYLSEQKKPLPKTTIRDKGRFGVKAYPMLARLEKEGRVRQAAYQDTGSRGQSGWEITDKGREQVKRGFEHGGLSTVAVESVRSVLLRPPNSHLGSLSSTQKPNVYELMPAC